MIVCVYGTGNPSVVSHDDSALCSLSTIKNGTLMHDLSSHIIQPFKGNCLIFCSVRKKIKGIEHDGLNSIGLRFMELSRKWKICKISS